MKRLDLNDNTFKKAGAAVLSAAIGGGSFAHLKV
jgi:Ran GTPase-activating protein (RanGAP) involved in mRNA processing and transport